MSFGTGYLLLADPRTLTLLSLDTSGTTEITVELCAEGAVTQKDALKYSLTLDGTWKTFTLWVANLGGYTPKKGDFIRDSSNATYLIRQVETLSHRQRFRCIAQLSRGS